MVDGNRWLNHTQQCDGLISNGVSAIAVSGVGPVNLPATNVRPGGLTSIFVRNGRPAENVLVTICWEVYRHIMSAKPEFRGRSYQAETDKSGRFTFKGIPAGYYEMAVRKRTDKDVKWYSGKTLYGLPNNLRAVSGRDVDIGVVLLTE